MFFERSLALLRQGLARISEDHAVGSAEDIEPSLDDAEVRRVAVWDGVTLTAMAAAATGTRPGAVGG